MSQPVYVLAATSRTPIGLTAESTSAAAHAGICRVVEQPHLLDRRGRVVVAAHDPILDSSLGGVPRMLELARWTLRRTAERINAATPWPDPVPVFVGMPQTRDGFGVADAKAIVSRLVSDAKAARLNVEVEVTCSGHAGALQAMAAAHAKLAAGRTELCIVGGVDSLLDAPSLSRLDRAGRLAGSGRRGSVFPGEAAAFVVVGTKGAAQQLKLPRLARILGVGSAIEPRSLDSGREVLGEGLTQAILAAMNGVGGPVEDVYGDLDGERYRSEEWGFAQLSAHSAFRAPQPCRTFAGCWGDCGAALGALHLVQAALAWQQGRAVGMRAMVWGLSEAGQRAAVVLGSPELAA